MSLMEKIPICSINGRIVDKNQAVLSLQSIEAQYGFGVYENIKVRKNVVYFVDEHIERLLHSAKCIALSHGFTSSHIYKDLLAYKTALRIDSYNLKLLLLGGKSEKESQLVILAALPKYPKKQWYRDGVSVVSYQHERFMPEAKTLNMLPSYFFYKKAASRGHYDAILLDDKNHVIEGTRTNIFFIKGKKIYHPPIKKILLGVTMMTLKRVLAKNGFNFEEKEVGLKEIIKYDGMMLTSTSSKILPVCKVDDVRMPIPESLRDIIKIYDAALPEI